MYIKYLGHCMLAIGLLVDSKAFSSTRYTKDFLLEGLLPSKKLHSKIPLIDFFPKCTAEKTVKKIKNGGFFVKERIAKDFQGVFPVKQPKLLRIPPNFFPENREGVFVKRIDGRTLFVRENRQLEKSHEMYKTTSNKLGILGKIDRRIPVTDPFSAPFASIALLRMTYSIFPDTKFVYYGTCFRNKLNQLVTAGHNLTLDEKEIKNNCLEEGIVLKNYLFKKNKYSFDVIFGLQGTSPSNLYYSHMVQTSAEYSHVHSKRDFGIIQLPKEKSHFFDENVGALGFTPIPNSPNDHDMYLGKNVMLAGYPGEKSRMYKHSGKIKEIDVSGIIYYTADTTPGNSGSPGFLLNGKNNATTVCLVHTHHHKVNKLNAGEKIDNDLLSFMKKYDTQ